MKISILSKSDETGGGASRIAAELSRLLMSTTGMQVKRYARTDNLDYIDISGKGFSQILYKGTRAISRSIGFPDIFSTEYMNLRMSGIYDTDIIHVHDISSAISPLTLKKLSSIAPIIWTFHDSSPFTGGCIQPMECTTYLTGCKNCPSLKEWPMKTDIDNTGRIQRYKLNLINDHIYKIICPSEWIAKNAKSVGIKEEKISVIHNATDTKFFRPTAPTQPRQKMLSILLFSMDIENKYKGSLYAKQIINSLQTPIKLIVVGKNSTSFSTSISPIHIVEHHEPTFDKFKIANFYNQADLLLFPSLSDNCPITVLEALSSGLPVISYETGGIPEILESEVCGYLFPQKDIAGPVRLITEIQSNIGLLEPLRINARIYAKRNFGLDSFLRKHLEIYKQAHHEIGSRN